jgi:hypothetical protein
MAPWKQTAELASDRSNPRHGDQATSNEWSHSARISTAGPDLSGRGQVGRGANGTRPSPRYRPPRRWPGLRPARGDIVVPYGLNPGDPMNAVVPHQADWLVVQSGYRQFDRRAPVRSPKGLGPAILHGGMPPVHANSRYAQCWSSSHLFIFVVPTTTTIEYMLRTSSSILWAKESGPKSLC